MEQENYEKRWLTKVIRKAADDVLAVAGDCAVTCGAYMIWKPAGWIIGGAFLIVAAVIVGKARSKKDTPPPIEIGI